MAMRWPVTEVGCSTANGLLAWGPGRERQGAQPLQILRVPDLDQGAADDHAPAGPGRLVDGIDLEGNRRGGGVQLGSRVGPEHHPALVEDIVEREDHWALGVDKGQPAEVMLGKQAEALGIRAFLQGRVAYG
jgi:hypothetical protein